MGAIVNITEAHFPGTERFPFTFGTWNPDSWARFHSLEEPVPQLIRNWSAGGPALSNYQQASLPLSMITTQSGWRAIDFSPYMNRRIFFSKQFGGDPGPGTLAMVFTVVRKNQLRVAQIGGLLLYANGGTGIRLQSIANGANGVSIKPSQPMPRLDPPVILVISTDGNGTFAAGLHSDGSTATASGIIDMTGVNESSRLPVFLGANETPGETPPSGPQFIEAAYASGLMLTEEQISTDVIPAARSAFGVV